MKIQKNKLGGGGGSGGVSGRGGRLGGGGGVRVDVNEELKFLGKFKKKNWGGGRIRGVGSGRGGAGCRVGGRVWGSRWM